MKSTTWAIIILSVLLAIAVGVIIYILATSDQRQRDAIALIDHANTLVVTDLTAQRDALQLAKDTLTKSDAEKGRLIAAQKVLIARGDALVADLREQQRKSKEIAAAAVAEGADLKAAFDAGEPVVSAIAISALTDWYSLVGTKLDPLLATIIAQGAQIAEKDETIDFLAANNVELAGTNAALEAGHQADALTIGSLGDTITLQTGTIASLTADLKGARSDLTAVVNSTLFWKATTVVAALLAAAATIWALVK